MWKNNLLYVAKSDRNQDFFLFEKKKKRFCETPLKRVYSSQCYFLIVDTLQTFPNSYCAINSRNPIIWTTSRIGLTACSTISSVFSISINECVAYLDSIVFSISLKNALFSLILINVLFKKFSDLSPVISAVFSSHSRASFIKFKWTFIAHLTIFTILLSEMMSRMSYRPGVHYCLAGQCLYLWLKGSRMN